MNIIITSEGNETVAALSGRLDTLAAQTLAPQFEALQQKTEGTLILDCTDLTYISSSGLRSFLTLRKAAAAKRGRIIIRNLNTDVRNVFMMTGFLNLFEIDE